LLRVGWARRTNFASGPSVTRPACAEANPARLSDRMLSTSFRNFFIGGLQKDYSPVLAQKQRQPMDKVENERFELLVHSRIAEVGQRQGDLALARRFRDRRQPPRVGARISLEERGALLRRKVADLQNQMHMARGDRHLIRRIRDLRNETAVLADRLGQALAHAGWPALEHRLQDLLVFGDAGGGVPLRAWLSHGPRLHF